MENTYMYLGIAAISVILVAVFVSKNMNANLSKKGFKIEKKEGKENVSITNIKNNSDIDINTKNGQNLNIDDINKSKVRINKNNTNNK